MDLLGPVCSIMGYEKEAYGYLLGKTLLARAVAATLNTNFLKVVSSAVCLPPTWQPCSP